MHRIALIVTLAVVVTACQASGAFHPATPVAPQDNSRNGMAKAYDPDCSSEISRLQKKGGVTVIPGVPSTGDFFGGFHYGPLSADDRDGAIMDSCSDNAYNAPIPQGYTPDWFGQYDVCGGTCAFSFGPGKALMRLYSSTLVAKRPYYLYLYTLFGGTLIGSYPAGVPHKSTKYPPYLKFASPFANGFTWPSNDVVSLELVHSTQ